MKEIDEIRVEARALESALAVIEGSEDPERAKQFAREYQKQFRQPKTPEGYALATALRRICGQPMKLDPADFRNLTTTPDRATTLACVSWVNWALDEGQADSGLFVIEELKKVLSSPKSTVDSITLDYWGRAIEALLREDSTRARGLFRHATKLGSQYGNSFNPILQWTYCATFWPAPCEQ